MDTSYVAAWTLGNIEIILISIPLICPSFTAVGA